MKKLLISAGLVFAVAAAVQAQDMYGTDMKNMPMEGNETQGSQAAPTASAEGTIKALEPGKVTLAHGPVSALKWPAMTMGFKATPEQIASVQAGQKVQFEFESQGMDSTITQISPVK